MLQRIQSIFLFLAALAFGALFKFPFASLEATNSGLFQDGLFNVFDNPIMMGLTGLGLVLSLVTIFLYNNRSLQIRLSYIIIILSILVGVIAVVMMLNQGNVLPQSAEPADEAGLYIPIVAVVAAALAVRFINKDEKLVKSMDRLR